MARDIRKPARIKETDVKDFAGEVVIYVRETEDEAKPVPTLQQESQTEVAAVHAVYVPVEVPAVKLISFNAWFQKAIKKNPRVKLSYKEAIEAHCKAVGIDGPGTEEGFEAALQHFGL